MKVHFADGDPSGDAGARLVGEEIGSWQPPKGADWAELVARAEGAQARRWALVVGGVVWLAAVATIGASLAQHVNGALLEEVRARLAP
jgi:hypothetical protein